MWNEVWPGNYQFDPTGIWLVVFPALWLAVAAVASFAYLGGRGPLARSPTGSFWPAVWNFLKIEVTLSFVAFLGAAFLCVCIFIGWTLALGAGAWIGFIPRGTEPLSFGILALMLAIHVVAQFAVVVIVWRAEG